MELKEYYMPEMLYVFIEKRWGTISALTGLIYCVHLFFAIYGVDQFTDISRLRPCKDGQTPEEASAVYQTAIGLAATFHIIEWLRMLVVLATALIGSNLNILYYILSINMVYGVVVLLIAIIVRFSGDGPACAAEGKQSDRGLYLALQIVCLILYIFTSLHMHLMMYCLGKEKIHEIVNEPEEDSEEEDEGDKED